MGKLIPIKHSRLKVNLKKKTKQASRLLFTNTIVIEYNILYINNFFMRSNYAGVPLKLFPLKSRGFRLNMEGLILLTLLMEHAQAWVKMMTTDYRWKDNNFYKGLRRNHKKSNYNTVRIYLILE